jgi:hypothetical protein
MAFGGVRLSEITRVDIAVELGWNDQSEGKQGNVIGPLNHQSETPCCPLTSV